MKKIDIHCHTSFREIKDCANPDASPFAIQEEMDKYDVEKTVLLATYFPHKGTGISNYRLYHMLLGGHTFEGQSISSGIRVWNFMMFGSLDFEHYFYQGFNELEQLAMSRVIKGIKIYTCYQEIDILGKNFEKVMELAIEYKLPVMFHTGVSYASYRKYGTKSIAHLYTAKELSFVADCYPEINFVFSHLSKPAFSEMVRAAKKYPNIYSDMSGLIDSKYNRDEIPRCIENINNFVNECGPEKLIFGTDFPVQTHEDSVMFIEEGMKGFSEKDKKMVYYDNAAKLLKYTPETKKNNVPGVKLRIRD